MGAFIAANINEISTAITAVATIFIAVFTIVLALVTNRQAKLTKRTADIAERALVELEQPILQIVDPFPGYTGSLLGDNEDKGMLAHYSIENFGRTPATLHEISLQFGNWSERPSPPRYEAKVSILTVIPQGNKIKMVPHQLPPTAEKGPFVFGYLKYADIFGMHHTMGFGLRRSQDKIWIVSGGAEYNYHRIEQKPDD